jgi:type I restriction enzyme M protein
MPNISSIVKNVRNIMRNEDQGISGDAQRLEQLGWMLFLKILDEKDQELELIREGYITVIPEKFQWRTWATDPEGITGDDLLLFIDHPTDGLFAHLKELQSTKAPKRDEQDVLRSEVLEGFSEEMIDHIHALQKEKESFSEMGIDLEEKSFYDILKPSPTNTTSNTPRTS